MRSLVLLVAAFLLPLPAQADIPDVVERASLSVVVIKTDDAGTCSGVAYAPSRVVTVEHCMKPGSWSRVVFRSGAEYKARTVGVGGGVAVLQVDSSAPPLPPMVPSARKPRVGETAIAIGHPYGHRWTVTVGYVSYVDRVGAEESPVLQFSSGVLPGSSGGPVLTAQGEWIGMANSIFAVQGFIPIPMLGFAVPADQVVAGIKRVEGRR